MITPETISFVVSEYHLQLSPFQKIRLSRRLMISAQLMVYYSILLGLFCTDLVSDFFTSRCVSSIMNLLAFRQFQSSFSMRCFESLQNDCTFSTKGPRRVSNSLQMPLMTSSCPIFSLIRISFSLSTLLQEWISARLASSQINWAGWMFRCYSLHFEQISLFAHFEYTHIYSHIFLWISHSELIVFLFIEANYSI